MSHDREPKRFSTREFHSYLSPRWLKYLETRPRLLLSIAFAAVVWGVLPSVFSLPTQVLCIWDAAMFCFLGLTWLMMTQTSPQVVRKKAQQQDLGRLIILSFIMAAATVSVMAIAFLLKDTKGTRGWIFGTHVALAIGTILGAWFLVHTIFALHYARTYYQDKHLSLQDCQLRKLNFPNELEPDYWDFLYFSFVIGMTSQVSDVAIISRDIRRLALGHGILSFFFNTAIVAMSINIIAGLIG
jgi:uncharacterized membrane protein